MRFALMSAAALMITGCAMSMPPRQFMVSFPDKTQSAFFERSYAYEAVASGFCNLLVMDRHYAAPLGFTVEGDVQNGAKGVDEWVRLDGGNAYTITHYEWITIDQWGSTQLNIQFDTMLCEENNDDQIEV